MPRNRSPGGILKQQKKAGEWERAAHDYLHDIETRPDELDRVVKISALDKYEHPDHGTIFNKLRRSLRSRRDSLKEWIRRHHKGIMFAGEPQLALLKARRDLERLVPFHFGTGETGRPFSVADIRGHENHDLRAAAIMAYDAIRKLRRAGYEQGTLGDLLSGMFPGQLTLKYAPRTLPRKKEEVANALDSVADHAASLANEIHGIKCLSFENLRSTHPTEWKFLRRAQGTEAKLRLALRKRLPDFMFLITNRMYDQFVGDLGTVTEHMGNVHGINVSHLVGDAQLVSGRVVPFKVKSAALRVRARLTETGSDLPTLGELVARIARSKGITYVRGKPGPKKRS